MGTVENWGSHGPSEGHCGYAPDHSLPRVVNVSDFFREVRNLDLRVKSDF